MKKKKTIHLRHKKKQSSFIRSFKQFRLHHRILFYIVGSMGVILVWKGAWTILDNTPIFSNPFTSLFAGLGLAGVAGFFFEVI